MRAWILIRDLFKNKIYLLPVRCRVFDIYKICLIFSVSRLIAKVKSHICRGIGRIAVLRLLLYQFVASTPSRIKEMLVISAALHDLWNRRSRIIYLLQLSCLLNNQDINHFIFINEALRDSCVRVYLGDLLEGICHVMFLKF
jgi:hypothetical protein